MSIGPIRYAISTTWQSAPKGLLYELVHCYYVSPVDFHCCHSKSECCSVNIYKERATVSWLHLHNRLHITLVEHVWYHELLSSSKLLCVLVIASSSMGLDQMVGCHHLPAQMQDRLCTTWIPGFNPWHLHHFWDIAFLIERCHYQIGFAP